jgi:hypothetical protein
MIINFSQSNPKVFLFLAALALLAAAMYQPVYAASDDAEIRIPPLKERPEGFAGLKWGDPSENLGDDKITFSENGGDEHFTVPGEGLTWEGFAINDARFSFSKNKLTVVRISFADSVKTSQIKSRVMSKFDKPSLETERNGGTAFVWNDADLGVILQTYTDKAAELILMNHKLAQELAH